MTEAVPHWQRGVVALGAILDPAEPTPRLAGSGFIIDAEAGFVVTCAHVVDDIHAIAGFAHIVVGLGDPVQWQFRAVVRRYSAREDLDLALLQLTANLEGAPLDVPIKGLTGPIEALPLGDSDQVQAGEPIVVLGYGQPEQRMFRTQTATTTQGVVSGRLEDQTHGRSFLKTDGLVLGGHSGGPALNRRGGVIGWNAMSAMDKVRSGNQAVGLAPSGLNLLRPVNALLGEVAALLATLTPLRQGPSTREMLRGAIPPGTYVLEQAVVALHAAAAEAAATRAAEDAQLSASGAATAQSAAGQARDAEQGARSAAGSVAELAEMGYLQAQMQMSMQMQMAAAQRLTALESRGYSLQIGPPDQIFPPQPWVRSPSPETAASSRLASMPLLASPSTSSASSSRESSQDRSCTAIENIGIVIEGDYPLFDEKAFKRSLANLLHYEVNWRYIDIDPAMGRPETVARVGTGSCEMRVECAFGGQGPASCEEEADQDRIEAFVRQAIRKHWPRGVEATDVRVKLSRDGSIILVLELPQPLPVLLMHLVAQRSPKLLEAVPGLLCCQLGNSVVRLEACEERHVDALAAAMEQAERMIVPMEEASRAEPSSEACTICGRQRLTCSYGDVSLFEPKIGAVVFAENHFAALGLDVEQADTPDFPTKLKKAVSRLCIAIHPDKHQVLLADLGDEPAAVHDCTPDLQESRRAEPQHMPANPSTLLLAQSGMDAVQPSEAASEAPEPVVPKALPPIWTRAGSNEAFQRLMEAKQTLLDDAKRIAHVADVRSGTVRRGVWECDARKSLWQQKQLAAMDAACTIDGFTLFRRHGGQLVCLGAGGFAVVLKAAAADGTEAALKLIIRKTTQDLETARKEKILQKLPEHQHVVKLFSFHEHPADTGCFSHSGKLIQELRAICAERQQQRLPYPKQLLSPEVTDTYCVLAFELAGQQDMMSWYETYHEAGDVPPDDKLRMAATQQASALAHLHAHGIVHHSFKAEDIMITISNNAGVTTKLADFGLARRAAHGHPGFIGSKGCAAPEMWRPAAYAGTAADVWSYGVLLFSLGFGVVPFTAANDSCQMFRIFTAAGGSARQQWERFPASYKTKRNDGARERHEPASNLLDLVDRCLQLTPGARPTMQQIATYLESHREGSWYADPASAPAAKTSKGGAMFDDEGDEVVYR